MTWQVKLKDAMHLTVVDAAVKLLIESYTFMSSPKYNGKLPSLKAGQRAVAALRQTEKPEKPSLLKNFIELNTEVHCLANNTGYPVQRRSKTPLCLTKSHNGSWPE